MKINLRALLFAFLFAVMPLPSLAADQDDAAQAAKEILHSLREGQYTKLWDTQTSAFFKAKMTKDSFLANMSMGRQQLGKPGNSKFVDMAYSQSDPSSGTKGEIYAFNYLNAYAAGNFYERVVVIKEADGKFRMAGLWGSPASK
jgi:hypothetical protein